MFRNVKNVIRYPQAVNCRIFRGKLCLMAWSVASVVFVMTAQSPQLQGQRLLPREDTGSNLAASQDKGTSAGAETEGSQPAIPEATKIPPRELAEKHLPQLQQPTWSSETQQEVCRSVAALAESATSQADYNELISCCYWLSQVTDEDSERSFAPEQIDYLRGVHAWALGKRAREWIEIAGEIQAVGNSEQAALLLTRATEDLTTAIDFQQDNAFNYLYRGVARARLSNWEKAEQDFAHVCQVLPDKAVGWFNRAELRAAGGQWEQAAADYRRVLKISSNDQQARNGLALCLLRTGSAAEAIELFSGLLAIQPENPRLLLNRADAACVLGHWQSAFDDYQQAAKLDADGLAYQRAAWLLVTCPADDFFKPETAGLLVERAENGQVPQALLASTRAAIQAAQGDFENALLTLERASAIAEQDPGVAKIRRRIKAQRECYVRQELWIQAEESRRGQ